MARIISEEAALALQCFEQLTKGNTHVATSTVNGVLIATMKLHGTEIARHVQGEGYWVCDGDYNSPTTRARLNSIPGVQVYNKNHQLYLNGEEWNGSWRLV